MRLGTIVVVAVSLSCGAGFAPRSAHAQGMTVRQTIESQNRKFCEFLSRGDAAGVAGLYVTKAKLLPPNGEIVTGRAEIEKYWQGAYDSGLKSLRLTTAETEGRIDSATELGTYEVLGDTGQVVDRGKFIVIWKVETGTWRLYRDIWNSSLPAAPAGKGKK